MAERHARGYPYDDESENLEPSRTRRELADEDPDGRSRNARFGRRYGGEHRYAGGRGGYGAERPGYEGAGHESGMGWGPDGRLREGYGRSEYAPEDYGRGEFTDRGQRGFAREGFGGLEGYNERGLGSLPHGPGAYGERSYAGYGDWSERARLGDEPDSPLGEHRRRRGAPWGLGRSGSGAGWRRAVRRGGAEEAQAGAYAGRGPKGYQRSDERIREDVCDLLMADPDVDASSMSVTVKDGEVTLEGTAEDRRTKRAAEDLADDVAGVKQVHNRLRVAPRGTDAASGEHTEHTAGRATGASRSRGS